MQICFVQSTYSKTDYLGRSLQFEEEKCNGFAETPNKMLRLKMIKEISSKILGLVLDLLGFDSN